MRLTLLGTGDARQVPVYGCDCPACRNARADAGLRRRPCSALLECAGQRWLIDSGLVDLCERFPPHSLDGILQTHYHADHAQGLLHLRWGQGLVIPVHGPADPEGLADLYKHPGILDFSQPFGAFERRQWGALAATALPLVHSKPTFGYLLEGASEEGTIRRLAYLTDTVGLPADSASRLLAAPLDLLVLDCSMPPQERPPRNHNDLTRALECIESLRPRRAVLTHVGHALDAWLLDHPAALPEGWNWHTTGCACRCERRCSARQGVVGEISPGWDRSGFADLPPAQTAARRRICPAVPRRTRRGGWHRAAGSAPGSRWRSPRTEE